MVQRLSRIGWISLLALGYILYRFVEASLE